MGAEKKLIRDRFRKVCLQRDKLACVKCGLKAKSFEEALQIFDVHHITDRTLMPNGGYVLENGITLCHPDHEKAEHFHSTGTALSGYSVDELYQCIGSTYEKAVEASKKLK